MRMKVSATAKRGKAKVHIPPIAMRLRLMGHLAKADPYGMTTKRQATATATANGNGSDKGSGSWWLFAAVGGFEVAAGGVGLGLVAASGCGEVVPVYGFVE